MSTSLAGGSVAAASTQTYTVTQLPFEATAMNASGEVVGFADLNEFVKVAPCPTGGDVCEVRPIHGFSWINGKVTDLGMLPIPVKGKTFSEQPDVVPTAVNASGEVVGLSAGIGFSFSNGQITQAGPLGFLPNAINDSGNMVGAGGIDSKAALLSGGQETLLPNLDTSCCNGASSDAVAINNSNEIAGSSEIDHGSEHAVVWNNGVVTDLGTLGGENSGASAINNLGQVVGNSETSTSDAFHAFLYSDGKMTALGGSFFATDINDNGVITGASEQTVGGAEIFSNGVLQNLNNLIPPNSGIELDQALAINDNGQILASGGVPGDDFDATYFLLTPTS